VLPFDTVLEVHKSAWDFSGKKWAIVSPVEHPMSGATWLWVHPCETAALLREVPVQSYLWTWWSLVAGLLDFAPSADAFADGLKYFPSKTPT
jgi:hypothetical protein